MPPTEMQTIDSRTKIRLRDGRIQTTGKFRKRFGSSQEFHVRLVNAGYETAESTVRKWYVVGEIPRKPSLTIVLLAEKGEL